MTTITGTYAHGLSLSSPKYNPLTITSTGSIGSQMNLPALYLGLPADNTPIFWEATNYGRITSEGTASEGVVIENGGELVNGSSAATGAYIAGVLLGVSFPKGEGHVVNYGTIVASSGTVVYMEQGGQVRNLGLLQGLDNSGVVKIDGAPGEVVNYGTINSLPGLAGVSIGLYEGGSAINGSPTIKTAVLAGGLEGAGFFAAHEAAAVSNYGSISGGYGVVLGAGGTVVNRGGITNFVNGVRVDYGSATIANFGTIKVIDFEGTVDFGTSDAVVSPAWAAPVSPRAAVNFAGTAGGSLTNGSNGYIGGGSYGVYATGAPVSLTNMGTIGSAVYLRMGGTVTNGQSGSTRGHLSGIAFGVAIEGTTANVVNYGTISASNRSGSAIELVNGGVVRNFGVAEARIGVDLRGTGSIFVNSGIVRSTSSAYGDAVSITSGDVRNSAQGYIGATYGVGVSNSRYGGRAAVVISGEQTRYRADISDGYGPVAVANNGTIADGVVLLAGGSVTNGKSGSTQGLITGIEASPTGRALGYQAVYISSVSGAMSVTNFGTIAAEKGAGVRLPTGGTVDNAQAGALISGTYAGIGIGGAGTVTNLGRITASGSTGVGVNLKNSFGQTVTNFGTITGAGGTAVAFGIGNDRLIVGARAKFNGVVSAGGGKNEIDFEKTGKVALAPEYVGFSVVRLGTGAADSLILTAADFAGITSNQITIYGGNRGNTITAALPGGDKLMLHGGVGADTFDLSLATLANAKVSSRVGADRLAVTSAGSVAAGGVDGVETFVLSNAGRNTLVLRDQNFAGVTGRTITVDGGNAGNAITAALPAADKLVLRGGSGSDTFRLTPTTLASSQVSGGVGSDRLVLTAGGTAQATHVSGVETFQLADSAAARIALADGNFTGITGTAITVIAGAAGDTVDASAVSAAHRVVFVGGAGKDVFTGGAGADTFEFAAAAVGGIDRLRGAGGNDRLVLKSSGTIANAGVFTGIETIVLASTGKNRLALTDSNFAGVTGKTITVTGGNAGNTIDASALSAANRVILVGGKGGDTLKGGAGADRLTAFGHATLSGEGGADLFAFEIPGTTADPDTNRITDFSRAQGDALAFSDAGFHLGLPNASATPKALPAALFSPKIDGSFDKPGERFAYDTSTGRLYFDADGNGSSDHRQLIATFANHPASLAGALLFVS